jgi:iron transport multicopper oxidase
MIFLLILSFFTSTAFAALRTYNWDITWVEANPDGRLTRPVIGINNNWPGPLINVTLGDTVQVNVNNKLGNESCTIHWHGLLQKGTPFADGPEGVTQCGIPPGKSYTYSFTVRS